MGPFHVNNTFGRHLGCHYISNKLSKHEMINMIQFHNLLIIKEQFKNNMSVLWVHFMQITHLAAILDAILI